MLAQSVKFSIRMGGALVVVAASVLIAGYLGPQDAGYYFLGLTLATVLSVICRRGADNTALRYVASYTDAERHAQARVMVTRLFRATSWPACGMALLGAALLAALVRYGLADPRDALMWALYLSSVPALCITAVSGVVLQAAGYALSSVFLTHVLVHGIVAAAAVRVAGTVDAALAVAMAFSVASMLAMAGGMLLVRRALRRDREPERPPPPQEETAETREIRQSARANYVSSIANLAILWIPLALLGVFSSPTQAALYGVAGRVAQVVSSVLPGLNFVVGPRFARQHSAADPGGLARLLRQSIVIAMFVSTAIAVPILLLSRPILEMIGPSFVDAYPILAVLLLAQWVNGACGPVNLFLAMTGNEHRLRNMLVASATVGVALGVITIPLLDGFGAALMSACCLILLNIGSLLISARYIRAADGQTTGARMRPVEAS